MAETNEYNNPYLTPELLEAAREGAREQERRKNDPLLSLIDKVKAEYPYRVQGDYDTYCDYNQGWQDALDMLDSLLPTVED